MILPASDSSVASFAVRLRFGLPALLDPKYIHTAPLPYAKQHFNVIPVHSVV